MKIAMKYVGGAIGILFTVGLLYYLIYIYDQSTTIADTVTKEQMNTQKELVEYGIMKYDGREIAGATAISYIKSVVGEYGIPVSVTTSGGNFEVCDSSVYADLRNISSIYYINPMSQYFVTVIRDSNDIIESVEVVYVP